jgi:hypothetical protein
MLRTSALLSCALVLAGLVVGLLIRQDANAQDTTPRVELTCRHFEVEPSRDGGGSTPATAPRRSASGPAPKRPRAGGCPAQTLRWA